MASCNAGHALAGDEAMMVAGIGCRAGASAEDVAEALAAALDRCGIARTQST